MKQQYTSANTCINVVNAVYKNIDFEPGSIILDYGGGKYDANVKYMAAKGSTVLVYDPYNRSPEHNASVFAQLVVPPKYIVCSNVLNVIKEDECVMDVINHVLKLLDVNGRAYFKVYEGNGSREGSVSKKGYQRNAPARDYLKMISSVFPNCVMKSKNKIITAWGGDNA